MQLHDAPPPHSHPMHHRPGVQFNTLALLLILTAASVILAAYVGVGRALDSGGQNALINGLQQLAYYTPQAIIWIVGLAMALQSGRLPRSAARLVVISLTGFLLTMLLGGLAQMVLISYATTGALSGSSAVGWLFLAYSTTYTLINCVWWVLLLMAVFRGRNETSHTANATTETPQ